MKRRRALRISGMLLAVVLLAGCGDKERPQGAGGSDTQAQQLVDTEAPVQQPTDTEAQAELNTYGPMQLVKINGVLYYNTGETNNGERCGMMDGNIASVVDIGQTPSEDGQANFEAEGYQWGMDDTIEIPIDGDWYVFRPVAED